MSSDTASHMTIRNTGLCPTLYTTLLHTLLDSLIVLLIIFPGHGDLLTREQNAIMQEIKGHCAKHYSNIIH